MQGAYFLVAATNASGRQVTLTASFFKATISVGDTLAGYTNVSQPLGTVLPLPCSRHDLSLQAETPLIA